MSEGIIRSFIEGATDLKSPFVSLKHKSFLGKMHREHSFWKNSEQYTILMLTIIFQYSIY